MSSDFAALARRLACNHNQASSSQETTQQQRANTKGEILMRRALSNWTKPERASNATAVPNGPITRALNRWLRQPTSRAWNKWRTVQMEVHRVESIFVSALQRWLLQPTSRAWNKWREMAVHTNRQALLVRKAVAQWRSPSLSRALRCWASNRGFSSIGSPPIDQPSPRALAYEQSGARALAYKAERRASVAEERAMAAEKTSAALECMLQEVTEQVRGLQHTLEEREHREATLKGDRLTGLTASELNDLSQQLQEKQVQHATALLKISEETARRGSEMRQGFTCPIAGCEMTDPVVTADGHSYERSAITAWLQKSNKSPMTNLPLEHTMLVPNVAMRQIIEASFRQSL